ncbi:hypothetical protein FMEXI_12907 [Fusarium mexicanum]|uniref:Uncharacterized protein n=1 Tax=Fusarium mexicanum TaxID=751941 RepID=A0A8H5MIQ2_9HYPO|nr:hypothetical protein FMEXI_12907 [Fusarium mexicanum]
MLKAAGGGSAAGPAPSSPALPLPAPRHLDSAAPAASASPSKPPYDNPDLALHSQKLSKNRSSIAKSLSVGHLLGHHGSPLEKVSGSPCFLYARRRVHLPNCQVFQMRPQTMLKQRPIVGHYHYNNLILERKRALTPGSHPITSRCNSPVLRIYQHRLRNVLGLYTAILGSTPMAKAPFTSTRNLRLTNKSDTTNAHIFQADIPYILVQALDRPTLDEDQVTWPTIQHIRVPFEPCSSFAERITAQLVGDKYRLSAVKPQVTAMEQGAKRKRDGLDAPTADNAYRRNVETLSLYRRDNSLLSLASPTSTNKPVASAHASGNYTKATQHKSAPGLDGGKLTVQLPSIRAARHVTMFSSLYQYSSIFQLAAIPITHFPIMERALGVHFLRPSFMPLRLGAFPTPPSPMVIVITNSNETPSRRSRRNDLHRRPISHHPPGCIQDRGSKTRLIR